MKRIGILLLLLLMASPLYAADVQRGYTYASDGEVTSTNLHQLVDDATVTDIDQTDIEANYGLTVKSSTQPSDTDSLWNDTSNNCLKAYISGAYEEVGTTPSSITTATITASGTITASDVTTTDDIIVGDDIEISGLATISETLTVVGHLSAGDQFGSWESKSFGVNYQANTDGFVIGWAGHATTNNTYIQGYTDSSTPATTLRTQDLSDAGTPGNRANVTFPVKKNDYYRVDRTNANEGTVYFIPLD